MSDAEHGGEKMVLEEHQHSQSEVQQLDRKFPKMNIDKIQNEITKVEDLMLV